MGVPNSKEYQSSTPLQEDHYPKMGGMGKKLLKVWENMVDMAVKDIQPERKPPDLLLMVLPNQPSEDSAEEVASRESPHSSMTTPELFSGPSLNRLLEMLSPTPSMLEEKPSLLWTLSMLLRDKAELSTASVTDHPDKSF